MTIIDDLRAKVDAELAAGRQVDFFEALAADKRVTKAMLVEWMLGPAQRGVKAERAIQAARASIHAADTLDAYAARRELAAALAALDEVQP